MEINISNLILGLTTSGILNLVYILLLCIVAILFIPHRWSNPPEYFNSKDVVGEKIWWVILFSITFVVCSAIISLLLWAITLISPALVFNWIFVGVFASFISALIFLLSLNNKN